MSRNPSIAFIPARGGSNGLRRKNITLLGGKPLLAYSIEAAQASSRIDRIIVSTEDEEIAHIAVGHGAEVPFLRPKELAKDTVTPDKVIHYTLKQLYGSRKSDVLCTLLYPTNPFRPRGLIDHLAGKVFDGHKSAHTVKKMDLSGRGMYRISNNSLGPLKTQGNGSDPIGYYRPYGLVSVGHYSRKVELYPAFCYTVWDKCCLVDIDYKEDLLLAQFILDNNLFDFEKDHASYSPDLSS